MLDPKLEPSMIQMEPSRSQQAFEWAMSQPGVLLLNSLAMETMLPWPRNGRDPPAPAERRVETEADTVDGDLPMFM